MKIITLAVIIIATIGLVLMARNKEDKNLNIDASPLYVGNGKYVPGDTFAKS